VALSSGVSAGDRVALVPPESAAAAGGGAPK
jgi:hypothetical protein